VFGIVVCPLVDVVNHVVVGLFKFHHDRYDGSEHLCGWIFFFRKNSFAFGFEAFLYDDEFKEVFEACVTFVLAASESFFVDFECHCNHGCTS
jgi:hypothetical protein